MFGLGLLVVVLVILSLPYLLPWWFWIETASVWVEVRRMWGI